VAQDSLIRTCLKLDDGLARLSNGQTFWVLVISTQESQRVHSVLKAWKRRRHATRRKILWMGVNNEICDLVVHCPTVNPTLGDVCDLRLKGHF